MYTFKGRAGSLATIVLVGELQSNLVMVGPARQGFTQVDDVSGGSVITAVLPQDGTYELHVSTLENQTGPYRLQVGLTTGTVIQPGAVAGTLSDQNRADAHLIRSDTGGVLTVGYRRTALLRNVALLSADGRTLVADGGQGGFTWLTAPALTYILMVYTEDFSSRNSYSLSMALQPPLPLAGGKAQGQVSRPGQIVIYRQDATKGQNAAILVTPVKRFDPDITIIQPDGTQLIQQNNGGPGQDELFTVQFRQRGLHLIVVSSPDAHATGGFHIVVTPDATPARPRPSRRPELGHRRLALPAPGRRRLGCGTDGLPCPVRRGAVRRAAGRARRWRRLWLARGHRSWQRRGLTRRQPRGAGGREVRPVQA